MLSYQVTEFGTPLERRKLPTPVTRKPLASAHETLMDLKAGRIIGRAVLVT